MEKFTVVFMRLLIKAYTEAGGLKEGQQDADNFKAQFRLMSADALKRELLN